MTVALIIEAMIIIFLFVILCLAKESAAYYERLWRRACESVDGSERKHLEAMISCLSDNLENANRSLAMMTHERNVWCNAWKNRKTSLPTSLTDLLEKGETG